MESNSEIRRELQRIYRARVPDRFSNARHCLTYARMARRDGDSVGFKEWIWCARVLRMAAARWRKRAEKLAPMLVCLVGFLHGCCAYQPVKVTDSLTAAPALVRPVCDRLGFNHAPRDAHWSGRAFLVWASDGDRVIAIDCDLLSVSADFAPLSERFDIQADDAKNLREFLTANGIAVNWGP
jgi:hypothetical protein